MESLSNTRTAHRASLDACFAHTDLAWRLDEIPDDAACRGAFFNMLDQRAGQLSAATRAEYRSFFRIYRFTPFRMYPVRDYITRMAVIAQLHWGAENIYSGIRTIQSDAFDAWSSTLLGRSALALIEPGLVSTLRMIERAYAARTLNTHADFSILSVSSSQVVTYFHTEYLYIEHAMVGALEAVMRICRVRGEVSAELEAPFDGTVRLTLG